MSGKKRIMVDESEWYRMQKQAKRLREIKRDLPRLIAEVRRQTEADLERVFDQVEQRQRRVDEVVSGLSERTQQFEAEVHQRMSEQGRRFEQSLRETAGELRQETRELLAEQEHAWRSELAVERQRRQEDMKQLTARLEGVEQRDERAAAAARTSLRDAQAIHALIRDTLPHERLAPAELDRLEQRLEAAQRNLHEGNPEAALAAAEDAYFRVSDLRVDLELADREWRHVRAAAGESLIRLRALIDQEAVREVLDEDGRVLEDVQLDVDYWTEGALSRLRDDVAAALSRVQDDEAPMEVDELREVVERSAPEFQERLAEIVERAALGQLASQLRVNLADAVVRTLDETAGYEFVDGTYAGEDQREAFYAKLVHENGNEIVVDVSPEGAGSGRCVLRLLSYDRDLASAEDRYDRAQAIASELRAQGMNVDEPEAEEGEPDPAFQDLEALRREASRAVAEG